MATARQGLRRQLRVYRHIELNPRIQVRSHSHRKKRRTRRSGRHRGFRNCCSSLLEDYRNQHRFTVSTESPEFRQLRGSRSECATYPAMLVDSHCHLDFDVFDEDRADAIKRAKDAGNRDDGHHLHSGHSVRVSLVSSRSKYLVFGRHPPSSGGRAACQMKTRLTSQEPESGRDRRNGPRLLL